MDDLKIKNKCQLVLCAIYFSIGISDKSYDKPSNGYNFLENENFQILFL